MARKEKKINPQSLKGLLFSALQQQRTEDFMGKDLGYDEPDSKIKSSLWRKISKTPAKDLANMTLTSEEQVVLDGVIRSIRDRQQKREGEASSLRHEKIWNDPEFQKRRREINPQYADLTIEEMMEHGKKKKE